MVGALQGWKGFWLEAIGGSLSQTRSHGVEQQPNPLWGMWRWRRADNVLDYRTCVIFIFSQGRPSNMTQRIGLQGRYPFPLCWQKCWQKRSCGFGRHTPPFGYFGYTLGDTPSLFVGEPGVLDLGGTPPHFGYLIRNIVIDGLRRCESYFNKMLAFKWQDFLSHFNGVIYDDDNFAKGLLINNEKWIVSVMRTCWGGGNGSVAGRVHYFTELCLLLPSVHRDHFSTCIFSLPPPLATNNKVATRWEGPQSLS